jgi:hypothetical protein
MLCMYDFLKIEWSRHVVKHGVESGVFFRLEFGVKFGLQIYIALQLQILFMLFLWRSIWESEKRPYIWELDADLRGVPVLFPSNWYYTFVLENTSNQRGFYFASKLCRDIILVYICKIRIDVQSLIDVHPLL